MLPAAGRTASGDAAEAYGLNGEWGSHKVYGEPEAYGLGMVWEGREVGERRSLQAYGLGMV